MFSASAQLDWLVMIFCILLPLMPGFRASWKQVCYLVQASRADNSTLHALRVQPDGPSADDLVELHLRQIVALNRWDDKYSYSVYVLYELELRRQRISILYTYIFRKFIGNSWDFSRTAGPL